MQPFPSGWEKLRHVKRARFEVFCVLLLPTSQHSSKSNPPAQYIKTLYSLFHIENTSLPYLPHVSSSYVREGRRLVSKTDHQTSSEWILKHKNKIRRCQQCRWLRSCRIKFNLSYRSRSTFAKKSIDPAKCSKTLTCRASSRARRNQREVGPEM